MDEYVPNIYEPPKSKIARDGELLTTGSYEQLRILSIKAIYFFLLVVLIVVANVYIDGYFEDSVFRASDLLLPLCLLIPTVLALILAVFMKFLIRETYIETFVKTLNFLHWLIPALLLGFVLVVRIAPFVK